MKFFDLINSWAKKDAIGKKIPVKGKQKFTIETFSNGDGEMTYYVVFSDQDTNIVDYTYVWENHFQTETEVLAYLHRYLFKHRDQWYDKPSLTLDTSCSTLTTQQGELA